MSNRISRLIASLVDLVRRKPENEKTDTVLKKLEKAETLPTLKRVMEESGMGEIPTELLDETGFFEVTGNKPRAKKVERRPPPTTGTVARRRRTSGRHKALNASSCEGRRGVIKPRRRRAS